ncbi:hypothetical protein JCM19233_5306 [Vibrio astriarenae]|nr:hypothetical protein JCM19233_5306 [Vibrio sp. C7]
MIFKATGDRSHIRVIFIKIWYINGRFLIKLVASYIIPSFLIDKVC